MDLGLALRDIIVRSFKIPQHEYVAELTAANAELGLTGLMAFTSAVRPKFFTGDPVALTPQKYLLVISLNHRYTRDKAIAAEVTALNAGPEEHYDACANYFRRFATYRFFKNFAPVMEGMGLPSPSDVLFMEALPYFSENSRRLKPQELQRLQGAFVQLNREAVNAVVTASPPAAIFLNGQTAFSALSAWSSAPVQWRPHSLNSRTGVGECRVEIADVAMFGIRSRAVRSNFLCSVHGPNSREQRWELGQLLAAIPHARIGKL